MCASVSQVGETGRTVGVEHIPELVERSIDAIKKTPAGALMETGRLVVHRMRLYASNLIFVFADSDLSLWFSTLNLLEEQSFEFLPSAPLIPFGLSWNCRCRWEEGQRRRGTL